MINKFLIVAAIVLVFSLAGLKMYNDIYQHGYKTCENDYLAAKIEENLKVVEKKKVIKHETQSLDRASIVRQLCAYGWVRDKTACPTE